MRPRYPRTKTQVKRVIKKVVTYLVLGAWFIFAMFPVYWMIQTSFKPNNEWITWPPLWLPENPTLENYRSILTTGPTEWKAGEQAIPVLNPLFDSLIVTIISSVISVMLGSFLAYGISRYKTGGENYPYTILMIRMLPPIVIAVTFIIYYGAIGLADTYTGLILVYIATTLPFSVWMMKSFVDDVPYTLEHAALIMGAGRLLILRKIIFPLVISGLMVTFVFIFILNWSEFLLALTLTHSEVTTLPVQLSKYNSADEGRLFGPQSAFGIIAVVPIVVLGIAIQKNLIKGFTFGLLRK